MMTEFDNDDDDDGLAGDEDDAMMRDMLRLSNDGSDLQSHNSSFKKRHRAITFESFDSRQEDFMDAQLKMMNVADDDELSLVSADDDQHKFESLLATIPQLLKKKTESSVRFYVTKYINTMISNVIVSPSLHQRLYEHHIHQAALAIASENIGKATDSIVNRKVQQQLEEEKRLKASIPPSLESLMLQVHSQPLIERVPSPAIPKPRKSPRPLSLPFRCLDKLNILQQRNFLSGMTLLLKRSILNVVDEAIPLLKKAMESEFLALSGVFEELEKFVFTDLKGFSDDEHYRHHDLSKILDYSHDLSYTDAQKTALSHVLMKAEKKLKRQLKHITDFSKSYYEQVEARITQITKACSKVVFYETNNVIIPTSTKKKLQKFDMTNVIDFIRGSEHQSNDEDQIAPSAHGETQHTLIKPVKTVEIDNTDHKKDKLLNSRKHGDKCIYDFISTRLRYDEAKILCENTKSILETHVQKQIKGVQSLLQVLDYGDELCNNDEDEEDDDDKVSVDESMLTQDDQPVMKGKMKREKRKSFGESSRKNLSVSKRSLAPFDQSRSKSSKALPRDISPLRHSAERNLVRENKQLAGHWSNNQHRESLHRSQTHGILDGLDLGDSTSRFALKSPTPKSKMRPSSATDHLTATELKTMMQKLAYVEFEFDRPVSASATKSKRGSSPPKPLAESLKFVGKPSSKFALTPQMIEQYQFSPKRINKYFQNLPINPEEKRKKMHQNRISDLTLMESTRKSSRSPFSNTASPSSKKKSDLFNESDTSFQLEEFLLGKRKVNNKTPPRKKKLPDHKSPLSSPNKVLPVSNSVPVLHALAEDKVEVLEERKADDAKQPSRSHKTSKASNDHDPSAGAAMIDSSKNLAQPKFEMTRDVLDVFHEPVVWDGDQEVDSLMIQKVMSHQMLDIHNDQQLYYQDSLEEIDIGDLSDLRMKFSQIFQEIGLIDEVDGVSSEEENEVITMKIQNLFYNLQFFKDDDDDLIKEDWDSLVTETETFSTQVVSLVSKIKSILNDDLLHPFTIGLHHSKLIRKEAELEILESFVKRSLESSRLQSMGVLSIPVDYFSGKTLQPSKMVDAKQKKLNNKIMKYARASAFQDLHSVLDKSPSPMVPFRTSKEKDSAMNNKATKEAVLASKPRTALEQHIDHSFNVLSHLRRQLRISLLNLLEMVCANSLFPTVFLMSTEVKHSKITEYLDSLKESIAMHAPFTSNLEDLDLSYLAEHESFSAVFSTELYKYDIDDYDLVKESLKSKIFHHAIFQLEQFTEDLLEEARETSLLMCPP